MTLLEIVSTLSSFDEEMTIYASEPWLASSEAILVTDADYRIDHSRPDGKAYFIEISVAKEVLEDFAKADPDATDEEACNRLILYAIYDA